MRPPSILLRPQTREAGGVQAGVGRIPTAFMLALAAAALLFLFDPATAGFYPPCLFKSVLGTRCPGCGSLRALHQLLHGNVSAAWALNAPLVIGLPLAAAAAGVSALRRKRKPSDE